ncbi:hypothetical protein Gotri_002683 [Gossypium trilobum]|uniref:RNase H type-1 domain-containing protein n=1 Tax=Gossypium trilobum TaxID=34281 RepID=A0A7J9F942_9ROSI|nr:hypothetical protein [Gossypium trilobum]
MRKLTKSLYQDAHKELRYVCIIYKIHTDHIIGRFQRATICLQHMQDQYRSGYSQEPCNKKLERVYNKMLVIAMVCPQHMQYHNQYGKSWAENFRIYGNISNNNIEKVYDLIDHSQRKWKVRLIRDTFKDCVADKILRIPLARLEHEDIVVWRGGPSGVFSVKSAYKLLLDGESIGKYIKELDEVGERMLTRNCTVPEWVPTRDPFFCFNFDASYDPKEFTSGSGLVARNIRGEILVTKSMLHVEVASPFTAEALACVQAVALGRSMGVDVVEIEGFLPRTTNRMAHAIATESLKRGVEMYPVGSVPDFGKLYFVGIGIVKAEKERSSVTGLDFSLAIRAALGDSFVQTCLSQP